MTTGYRIVAATGLDPGHRAYQQDQLCLLQHRLASGCLMAVVADGMGGRSGGRTAAEQVILTAGQLFARYFPYTDSAQELLERLAQEAHLVIRLAAITSEEEPHSTLASVIINPDGDAHCLHSGDSRIYHFRGQDLIYQSVDHSYVQQLVERGELHPEDAAHDPRSNILTSCLGGSQLPLMVYHPIERIRTNDVIMLCSDGLWHHFTPDLLAEVFQTLSPRDACEFLVDKARQLSDGKSDNISIIVIKFSALESEAEPDSLLGPDTLSEDSLI